MAEVRTYLLQMSHALEIEEVKYQQVQNNLFSSNEKNCMNVDEKERKLLLG